MLSLLVVIAVLSFSGIEARAAFMPYGFSGDSGVFAFAAGGPADGGLPNPNIVDNGVFFQAGAVLTANPLTSAAFSSYLSGNVMATGTANAGLGVLKAAATMTTDAQTAVHFPAGFADTGWVDTLLIQSANPADNGLVAMVSIILNVNGTLAAAGPNVAALLQLAVSSEVANNPALHQPFYQVQAGSNPSPQVVSDTLVLALPFIVGTPSQLLVRAMARAMTSSQTSFGNNTADVDFFNTVSWGGIQGVTVGGNALADFSATGTVSGINWVNPVTASVPEPSTLFLGLTALALVEACRRRRPG